MDSRIDRIDYDVFFDDISVSHSATGSIDGDAWVLCSLNKVVLDHIGVGTIFDFDTVALGRRIAGQVMQVVTNHVAVVGLEDPIVGSQVKALAMAAGVGDFVIDEIELGGILRVRSHSDAHHMVDFGVVEHKVRNGL